VKADAEGKMKRKRVLVAVLAVILGASACGYGSDTMPVPNAGFSPVPAATVERLDYYPEGDERGFGFELFYNDKEFPWPAFPGAPCRLTAIYREQAPHKGYSDGTAFIFGISGTSDRLSLAIPAGYAERIHLLPGNTYQIIAQIVPNWPDALGLIIKPGDDELVFQGISDWRFDAGIPLGCLSPVRVEQVGVLTQRYREGDKCRGTFTNTEMRFSLGTDVRTLHQGQSATLEDYEINLGIARTLDGYYCPDAGAINVSYTISQRGLGKGGASEGAAETSLPGPVAAQPISIPDANLAEFLRRLTNRDTGPLLGSDLEKLRCFVRLYPVGWNRESAPNQGRITSLGGLEHATNLAAIYLDGGGISDLSPLANLSRLTKLRIGDNELSDLSPLRALTSLTELQVANNQVSDLAPLSSLTGLTYLEVCANKITDVSPVSSLTNLADLSLCQNQISEISPLSLLVNLKRLRLDYNQIKDIAPLSALVSLIALDLDNNEIEDIAPLSPLVNLAELSLTLNSITDIAALAPLANLVEVYLGDNQIREISALESLTNLRLLVLLGNRIADISPLVRNRGFGEADGAYLEVNLLRNGPANRDLAKLRAKGVQLW
jgi:Leucine-rich repeat (LRR) protein